MKPARWNGIARLVTAVAVLTLTMASTSFAQRGSVDLHRVKEQLENVHLRLERGEDPARIAAELARIRSAYAERVERLGAELDRAEAAVSDLGLGALAAERLQRARDAFEESHVALLDALTRLADRPDLAEVEACLRALEPMAEAEEEDLLSAQELPLRELDLTPAPLVKDGPTTTESFDVESASLADSIGSVPEAIRELAEDVSGAVEAYELVKNETRFELYHGSMKGSVQTLHEGSGNDADINRLLVDLLRAEGVPARYVTGVVRLTVDQLHGLLGTELPERVEQALSAALVPYEPQFEGGGLAAVEVEHVWVEAYVPWSNYRGTGVDSSGRRWVPLDASFKFHTVDEGHRVYEEMGFDAEAFVREAFAAAPGTDPLVTLRSRVSSYLEENVPGVSFDDALRMLVQTPEVYGILPASLPYEIVSVNGVSFEFPEALEHHARFVATRQDGVVILDSLLPVSRLIGRRLTLSWAPATAEDREIAEAFGSIYETPPFLIEVRPVLRSAGLIVDTGGPITMGGRFVLESQFVAPAGVVGVDNRMIAGAYAALAISGRTPGYEERAETEAGEILNQRALNYLSRWNDADRELAGLTRVMTFRPIPSHVIVKNAIHVDYATNEALVPLTFEWKGIQVDADLRPTAPVPVGAGARDRREFFFLSGLVGSELESRILEEDLRLRAISTVELLRLAASRAVDVREIDADNVDSELATLGLEPDLEDAIAAHAFLGHTVLAPVSELGHVAWTGAGFAAWDPASGESAYILSGRIAGGSSVEPPEDFDPDLRETLETPTEPVSEPSRIVGSIEIVDSTNFQEVLVGRETFWPLEVIVSDEEGQPVADGVPVVFTAIDEGSIVASFDLVEEGTSITVPTVNGRARVRFRVGTSTHVNRRFLREHPDDEFLTQVGLYRVTAEAGGVSTEDSFSTFALPDALVDEDGRHGQMVYVSGGYVASFPLSTPEIPMWVEVVDGFRNPLSNMPVDWDVLDAARFESVPEPLPDVFENAKLHGRDFEELVDRDRRITSYLGSRVYVRLGDVDATRYKLAASTPDVRFPREPIEFLRDSHDLGSGHTFGPIGERLLVSFIDKGVPLRNGAITFESGGEVVSDGTLTMGPVNAWLRETVDFSLTAYQEEYEPVLGEDDKWKLQGQGRFTERDVTDARFLPSLLEGTGAFAPLILEAANSDDGTEYEFGFLMGAEPGLRRYGYHLSATLKRPVIDDETGEISVADFIWAQSQSGLGRLMFGVTATILPQEPDPFVLDGSGHLAPGSTLGFEILPEVVDEVLAGESFGRVINLFENRENFAFGELPEESPLTLNTVIGYEPQNVYVARLGLLPGTRMELFSEPVRLRFFDAFMKKSNPRPIHLVEVPDPERPGETKLVTEAAAALEYFVRPTALAIEEARVELIEVDRDDGTEQVLLELPGAAPIGESAALLESGFEADPDRKEYKAVLEVTPEGRTALRSAPAPVVFSRLLYEVSDPVGVTFQTGVEDVCFVPEPITYLLAEEADVRISILEDRGEETPIERVVLEARQPRTTDPLRPLSYTPGPADLTNANSRYGFRIHVTSVENPEIQEEYVGELLVQSTGNTVLPVGHTFVKGVDLLDGHLVSSSTDLSIAGRGPALELVRTYSSSGVSDDGVMGAGWSMNYFSTLIVSDCAWTVVGGDGSGQRFTRVGEAFVPQTGYHTELVRNDDGSFDFFTKGRIRYHYVDAPLFEGDRLYGGRPTLEFIEDPNGNRLELVYDAERNITQVKEVFRGGVEGRSLFFDYERVRGLNRLRRVTGPLGLEVTYEYDEYANLVRATRDERVEVYDYDIANPLDQHNLIAYTDPNGNTTHYRYYTNTDSFTGEPEADFVVTKFEWVRRVDEPEGVSTGFVYDLTELNEGRRVTTVTDGRLNDTIYTLNLNGSPLQIEEPGGIVTTMTWADTDIFKESETDANRRTTTFRYDDNANLVEEIITTDDFGPVLTEFEYDPTYNKMTLKRVHNASGSGVQETRFTINPANGNLEQTRDAEGNVTEFEYFPNGDLQFVRGPRLGQVTEFTYDAFGNPERTIDPEGNETVAEYDARSRLRSSRDSFGRSMTQEFDELDRVTRMTRVDDKGSSDTEVIVRDYYPGGQMLFETNGLGLTTRFTLDGLNRVIGTTDDLGHTTSTRYDPNSNVTEQIDRRGVRVVHTYDDLNRLTKTEVRGPFGPPQVLSEMDYDAVGNKLFETDIHGSRTDFVYDDLYRVEVRQLPTRDLVSGARHEERFTYDLVGNKLSETDANGNVTELAYDRLNRMTSRVDAEGNEVAFEYDAAGNVEVETDVTRGLETRTTYDFLNRPLSRVVTGGAPDEFSYETTFVYDDGVHETVETDPRGFTKTTVLDGFDRVHEVRQEVESGRELVTRNFYDANGNLRQTEDAERRTTEFLYDGLNRLREVRDALSQTTFFDYDGEGNKIEEVDRRGLPTRFDYDNLGRLIRTEIDQPITGGGPLVTSRVTYVDAERERIELDARGNRTRFEMDEQQRVVAITDPDGEIQRFEYDGVNKTAEVDKRGHRTELRYDAINRLTEVRDALGQTVTTVYRDAERQVEETDKRGLVKTTQLDALGRLVSVTRSGVLLESHAYDGNNNRTLSTDANGNETEFFYDGANRLIERVDGRGSDEETRTTFLYDDVGNLLEEKDGRDTGIAFDVRNTYDDLNRLETTTDAEGNTTRFEYDPEGNRTAVIEPKSLDHRTEFDYGELNELIQVRMPDGGIYNYAYDPNRNRTLQEDGEGNVVEFIYDRLNRVDRMIQDPDGFRYVTDHDYDPNGNETRLTDPKGQVIDFSYDELNRLKKKTYHLTAADFELLTRTHEITYHYDPNDNLERVDELKSSGNDPPAIVSSFKSYDALDRLTHETDAWGRSLTYEYDAQGNRTALIDPDSVRTEYTFDELNRLETLTLEAGTPAAQVVTYDYFPDGLKRLVTNPNGTTSTYTYDAADRMTTITHDGPEGVVSAYVYEYDENGNRTQQIETNAGRTETTLYDYDRVNRLTVVTYEAGTASANQVSYTYDLAGNRLTEQTVELETSTVTKDLAYTYDAINRLEAIDDRIGTDDVDYEYDANGNTTLKTKAGITTEFLYDIRDQLSEVQQDTSVLGRYGYDSEGMRILKIGDDGVRRYTYDQLSVITEANETNATVSKYDYGLDQLVSLDNLTEGRSFFHLDLLGSTANLTDGVGGTRQSILYDGWGNERDRVGTSANNFTFTGHEFDAETDLIYAKSRFYDPDTGRFLTQDSYLGDASNTPSLHRYAYVFSNPFRYVDPDGRQAVIPVAREDGTIEDVPLIGDSTTVTAEATDFFGRRKSWERPKSKNTGIVEESSHRDTTTGGDVPAELGKIFGGPTAEPPKFIEDALDTGAGYIHGAVIVFPVKTAKGVVTLTVSLGHVMWLDAKMKFGTDEIRREAAAEMSQINQAIANHMSESAGYLGRGLQEPGAVADAVVELGATRSASILGESAVDGALIVEGGIRFVQMLKTPKGTAAIEWVDETGSMSQRARDYQSSAWGASSNVATKKPQAPSIRYTDAQGASKRVRFDGLEGKTLVDRKISVTTFKKPRAQALRQSEALRQNGLRGRWEVPTNAQANRARRMLKDLGIKNIDVKVVPE